MINLINGFKNTELWAFQVIDSWGKVPSGMLSGNLYNLGNFDQCLAVSHNPIKNESIHSVEDTYEEFHGKYCLNNILLDVHAPILEKLRKSDFPVELLASRRNLAGSPTDKDWSMFLTIGICVPQTCTGKFLTETINYALEQVTNITNTKNIFKVSIANEMCQTTTDLPPYGPMDIFAISFFSIFAGLMLLSTGYDLLTRQSKITNPNLKAFSIFTNGRKLFECKNKKSVDVMECINGIRSLSIIWVVFGHTYSSFETNTTLNITDLLTWIQHPYSMLLAAGTLSVDTFFMLSGLLVTFVMLKHLDLKNGKINIPLLYLHRYLRLTPALAAAILLYSTLFRHFSSGPLWTAIDPQPICAKSWWTTLLYIQNYYSPYERCIGPTWYLMVDMQLFILSPFLIYPLWRWRNKFIWIIPILILSSMTYMFSLYIINHYRGFGMLIASGSNSNDMFGKSYVTTHTRFGAWGVGLIFGYILHNTKGKRLQLDNLFVISGWILSIISVLSIIFVLYPMNQPDAIVTDIQSAFYESLSRVCWAISIGWIVFACVHGYGGPINWFLSLPQWQPISRLTYCIFLLHMIVITTRNGSVRSTNYFSDQNAIFSFWGNFGITVCASVLWTMAFELPVLILEKNIG